MTEYEWVRESVHCDGMNGCCECGGVPQREYTTTVTPDPPPMGDWWDGRWKRVYSFGVGRVKGAGGSPSRKSR